MHLSYQIVLVVLAICVAFSAAGESNNRVSGRGKQPRATRGFKPLEIMTARGFGKRNYAGSSVENVWDLIDGAPERTMDQNDDKLPDSVPLDWFVDEMLSSPEFARTVVRKFIDTNQDGNLSQEELFKTTY